MPECPPAQRLRARHLRHRTRLLYVPQPNGHTSAPPAGGRLSGTPVRIPSSPEVAAASTRRPTVTHASSTSSSAVARTAGRAPRASGAQPQLLASGRASGRRERRRREPTHLACCSNEGAALPHAFWLLHSRCERLWRHISPWLLGLTGAWLAPCPFTARSHPPLAHCIALCTPVAAHLRACNPSRAPSAACPAHSRPSAPPSPPCPPSPAACRPGAGQRAGQQRARAPGAGQPHPPALPPGAGADGRRRPPLRRRVQRNVELPEHRHAGGAHVHAHGAWVGAAGQGAAGAQQRSSRRRRCAARRHPLARRFPARPPALRSACPLAPQCEFKQVFGNM